jgi:hypothetical protein
MTRDDAIKALKPCGGGHWHTGATCDSCWVNEHRCPETLVAMTPRAVKALKRAIEIGKAAESTLGEIRNLSREANQK